MSSNPVCPQCRSLASCLIHVFFYAPAFLLSSATQVVSGAKNARHSFISHFPKLNRGLGFLTLKWLSFRYLGRNYFPTYLVFNMCLPIYFFKKNKRGRKSNALTSWMCLRIPS